MALDLLSRKCKVNCVCVIEARPDNGRMQYSRRESRAMVDLKKIELIARGRLKVGGS